jgi:FixJ family two-component response regulator
LSETARTLQFTPYVELSQQFYRDSRKYLQYYEKIKPQLAERLKKVEANKQEEEPDEYFMLTLFIEYADDAFPETLKVVESALEKYGIPCALELEKPGISKEQDLTVPRVESTRSSAPGNRRGFRKTTSTRRWKMKKVIWVDDDAKAMSIYKDVFLEYSLDVIMCPSIAEALKHINEGITPNVLLDINFPNSPKEGMIFLEQIHKIRTGMRVVMLTGFPKSEDIVIALRDLKAMDYIEKPIPIRRKELESFFEKLHNAFIEQEKERTAAAGEAVSPQLPARKNVFISYSHTDEKWLAELKKMLSPIVRKDMLDIWDDTRLKVGDKWRDEIQRALDQAQIAVLLVTPDFLASDFIVNQELPPLLEAAEDRGLKIIWIAVSASMYQETELAKYQAANNPEVPLDKLTRPKQNEALRDICRKIKSFITNH